MTFKEFFNKRDNTPFSLALKPSTMTGMQVVKDFSKDNVTRPVSWKTKNIRPSKSPLTIGRDRLGDRPIEKKPSNFLPRAS